MIAKFTSYSVVDFIPYTQEIYYSLLANSLNSYFLLHLLAAILNLIWVWSFTKRLYAVQLCCLSLLWFICGVYFYGTLYAQINWAASKMEWVCYSVAFIFLLFVPSCLSNKSKTKALPRLAIFISFTALALAPLWPVTQVMDWNALSFPGLNSSSLWLLSLSSFLTLPLSRYKYLALLPGFILVIFSLMRFYAFHLA